MTLDFERKVFITHLRRLITLLVLAVLVILILLIGHMPKTFIGLNKYQWAIVVCGLYIVVSVFESLLELCYIYFSDEKGVITLRYFSLSYFNSKKNSIEIPVQEFLNYEIQQKFFGLKPKLILHRAFKLKDAKYPAVSLSLLSKKEIEKITSQLDKYKAK